MIGYFIAMPILTLLCTMAQPHQFKTITPCAVQKVATCAIELHILSKDYHGFHVKNEKTT